MNDMILKFEIFTISAKKFANTISHSSANRKHFEKRKETGLLKYSWYSYYSFYTA